MDFYAINIATKTVSQDRYGQVAINQYPILVYGTKADLMRFLQSQQFVDYIKTHLPSESLYKRSTYKIRHCTEETAEETFDIQIPEITKVQYDQK